MDRVRNPYTPNAGATPPSLAGRSALLREFDDLLARVEQGRTDKGIIVTGLRGVGKTVLLNAFDGAAQDRGAVVITHEATRIPGEFTAKFPGLARKALLSISPSDRWKARARRAAGVLKGFKGQFDPSGKWTVAYDGSKIEGVADSGDFIADLPDLMVAIGEAAAEHSRTVVFLIDEIQYLAADELSALVMAKHQINQHGLPIVFAGAGLPQLPAVTGQAQTYAERMFSWPEIGRLEPADAAEALQGPARDEGVEYEAAAVDHIVSYTDGYPFYLQEYGKAAWNFAETSPITLSDAQSAQELVEAVLDQDFFSVRSGHLPQTELEYVRALASLGAGEHAPAEIAAAMDRSSSAKIGTFTSRLIERGVIYRSKRGRVAFTVPHFERYVARTLDNGS